MEIQPNSSRDVPTTFKTIPPPIPPTPLVPVLDTVASGAALPDRIRTGGPTRIDDGTSPMSARRIASTDAIASLEAGAALALADLRRTRKIAATEADATGSPIEAARQNILASVAEIRHAMIPPTLTLLDRRR